MKSWLEKKGIEMYSTHDEGKSVIAEKFIRTLKNKIYIYMILALKNVSINKLKDIVNKYNNTFYSTSKVKPVDVNSNIYIVKWKCYDNSFNSWIDKKDSMNE